MIELGLFLTAQGMGGVFLLLSILAFVMWLMGKVLGEKASNVGGKIGESRSFESNTSALTEREILAIAAAIASYEGVKVGEVRVPEKWKSYARIHAMRWVE